jgi:hypothetical protein
MGLFSGTWAEVQSARDKLARIESGRLRPGSRVDFTPGELNAWVREESRNYVQPGAIRDLRLELTDGGATGFAIIDFLKLRQAAGEAPGWLARTFLAGERPVSVVTRIQTRAGMARVEIERVEVSGIPVEGPALNFLIQNYLRPTFPRARVSEWFALGDGVDHLRISRDGVAVFVTRTR